MQKQVFGPLDATQARQRLRAGSQKEIAGYQSRPKEMYVLDPLPDNDILGIREDIAPRHCSLWLQPLFGTIEPLA
jgi:hypothetical protein